MEEIEQASESDETIVVGFAPVEAQDVTAAKKVRLSVTIPGPALHDGWTL